MSVSRNFAGQALDGDYLLELRAGLHLVHWLPRMIGRDLMRLSPLSLLSRANAQRYFDETRPGSRSELAGFPSARIEIKCFLGVLISAPASG